MANKLPITIQFSANRNPFSALIRTATWSDYSHVDFVLPGGRLLGAIPGHGVAVRPATEFARAERFTVPGASLAVLECAEDQIGKPYDWRGVFGLGLRRRWQDSESWFCSELVAWAFLTGGRPLLRGDYWRITPRDLYLSTLLVPVDKAP